MKFCNIVGTNKCFSLGNLKFFHSNAILFSLSKYHFCLLAWLLWTSFYPLDCSLPVGMLWRNSVKRSLRIVHNLAIAPIIGIFNSLFQKYRVYVVHIEALHQILKLLSHLEAYTDMYSGFLPSIFSFFLQFLAHLLHFLLVPIYSYTSARKHSKAPYAYNCGR